MTDQCSSAERRPAWTLYSPARRWTLLAILFLVSTTNYLDRHIFSVLIEPIKAEFGASDTVMGLLSGFAFAALYATLGIPVARWADVGNRRVIITISIALWSVMTLLCGMVSNVWQLALTRFGVGAGEAGAVPPSQSLIADYFPPERRATAIAIFLSSATAGFLIGLVGGSYIATHYGWRTALIAAGLPGLLIAVLTAIVLREPRKIEGYAYDPALRQTVREAFAVLWRKPSFVNLLIAMTLYFFFTYGAAIFMTSYLVRVLEIPLQKAGAVMGGVGAAAAIVGTLGGGFFADRLIKKDLRWICWMPAIGLLLNFPIYEAAFFVTSLKAYVPIGFAGGMLMAASLPAGFSAIHVVCGSSRRALAIAMVFFFANLLGTGLGPVVTGAISDAFADHGPQGLRYALIICTLAMPVSALFFYRAARTIREDQEA